MCKSSNLEKMENKKVEIRLTVGHWTMEHSNCHDRHNYDIVSVLLKDIE